MNDIEKLIANLTRPSPSPELDGRIQQLVRRPIRTHHRMPVCDVSASSLPPVPAPEVSASYLAGTRPCLHRASPWRSSLRRHQSWWVRRQPSLRWWPFTSLKPKGNYGPFCHAAKRLERLIWQWPARGTIGHDSSRIDRRFSCVSEDLLAALGWRCCGLGW